MSPVSSDRVRMKNSIASNDPHNPQVKFNRSPSDAISYEDLLIAQYLEGLQRAEPANTKKRLNRSYDASPYLQRLSSSEKLHNASTSPKQRSHRPTSAAPAYRSNEKKRINAKFIADTSKWQAIAEEEEEEQKGKGQRSNGKGRPESAPVYHAKRPMSGRSWKSRPWSGKSSASSISSRKSQQASSRYRQQPGVIRVTAYKNGLRDQGFRITAPTMKVFLEYCTLKLDFKFAARRVFLTDGTEVKRAEDIPRDAEVYISSGEPFRDPLKLTKGSAHKNIHATWTMNGIVLPVEAKKKKSKTKLSKRMREMLSTNKRRILIFANGDGTEMHEMVADPEHSGMFLDSCTAKLGLTSPAKILYSWDGSVYEDIESIPKLDACLQSSSTPVYGPVWISKGEAFSPSGAKDFLETTVRHCKEKEKAGQFYKKEIQMAMEGQHDEITITKLLSMSQDELQEEMKETEIGVSQFAETRKRMKAVLSEIMDSAMEEKERGSTFKMQHIPQIDSSHRLVGQQGLRLKVYENGRTDGETVVYFNIQEASKGIAGDKTLLMERLLDTITRWIHPEQNTTALSSVVTTIFDTKGREIQDVYDLENDHEIVISFGEAFKDPNVYCLQISLDKARCYSLCGERHAAVKELVNLEEIPHGGEKPNLWQVTTGFPEDYKPEILHHPDEYVTDGEKMVRSEALSRLQDVRQHELDIQNHFLSLKDDPQNVLYAELSVQAKRKQGDKELWPSKAQTWVINKRGQIYCKAFPQLALSVLERGLTILTEFSDGKTPAQGLAVGLEKRCTANPNQEWTFSPDGYIYSRSEPHLVLTFIEEKQSSNIVTVSAHGDQIGDVSTSDWLGNSPDEYSQVDTDGQGATNELMDWVRESRQFEGQNFIIAVIPKLPARHPFAKSQRWALKQERLDNLGQWKYSTITNPAWNKLAYSWPVKEDGSWNEDFDWPMEGYFIAYAPPLKSRRAGNRERTNSASGVDVNGDGKQSFLRTVPLRLRVMKNGEKDAHRMAFVVGPDLTNMMKDLGKPVIGRRPFHRRSRSSEKHLPGQKTEEEKWAERQDMKREELKQLEFQLFLDRCTSLLNLPFAARRLFDENGHEHTNLEKFERDSLVYVSCGEIWKDPNLSTQEQQRRQVLAMLACDIDAMRQYCTLRESDGLVLEVEGQLEAGSRIIVNQCAITDEERHHMTKPSTHNMDNDEEEPEQNDVDLYQSLSAHQKSHLNSEQRSEGLKWPWERVMNIGVDEVTEVNQGSDPEEEEMNRDLYKKFKSRRRKLSRSSRLMNQQFSFQDGFLCIKSNPFLVVGQENSDVESSPLILRKKNLEDSSQRWEIDEEGFIHSKNNPEMVLTVAMPAYTPGDNSIPSSFCRQPVILQQQKQEKCGRANQRWASDRETGIIDAFAASVLDVEITAANKSSICTYAVVGETMIEQPGYSIVSKKSSETVLMCTACAKNLRANHRLQRLEEPQEFICSIGMGAAQKGLRGMGCFQCLSGKVDLSSFEAANTLSQYEKEFRRLKQMGSARLIAKEINAYHSVQSVHILAYRNGYGRNAEGAHLVGSTLRGILDQCTYALQLPSAARKLFTQDGTQVFTISDISSLKLAAYGIKNMGIKNSSEGDKPGGQSESTLSQIMRMPLEVWVSCGEAFVHLEQVDYLKELKAFQRAERSKVMRELDQERHVLRQMQGRRTAGGEGPNYVPTLSPQQPVLVEGGWTQPGMGEVKKTIQVHQLENHLHDMKAHQKMRDKQVSKSAVDSSKKLYMQPSMKRILVFKNGGSAEKALYCWGSSLPEILRDASLRLSLARDGTHLFTESGTRIDLFGDVSRDNVYCVTCGEPFKGNRGNNQVEVKANFARARKKNGPQATEILVTHKAHPEVEVDPFGPPTLALEGPKPSPRRITTTE